MRRQLQFSEDGLPRCVWNLFYWNRWSLVFDIWDRCRGLNMRDYECRGFTCGQYGHWHGNCSKLVPRGDQAHVTTQLHVWLILMITILLVYINLLERSLYLGLGWFWSLSIVLDYWSLACNNHWIPIIEDMLEQPFPRINLHVWAIISHLCHKSKFAGTGETCLISDSTTFGGN